MLYNVIKKASVQIRNAIKINKDPEFLPVVARLWIVLNAFIVVWITLISKSSSLHKLSACGIMFGVFGAGILYWETIANKQALNSVRSEILRSSHERIFSGVYLGWITFYSNIGFLLFLAYAVLIASEWKLGRSGLRAVLSLFSIFLVAFAPVVAIILFAKVIRYLCQRWLTKHQSDLEEIQDKEARRFLRYTGFLNLILSGFMQLPAALWG